MSPVALEMIAKSTKYLWDIHLEGLKFQEITDES
jgi:hypothetical protein